ncbi:Scr1 family TA system antitoxin-like transcriptional regulator [Streptomyces sp. NPDC059862]|uniref:helix-turn-helix domain-containing protein n=1 Tax=Streptomyces sp. NPDC059862 TaxID=3346975 RepID=UPI003651B218
MTVTEPQETYDEGEQAGDLNRAIGKQVKVLRERAGLTQKELGDRLGYSEDLISSLERGRRTPQREFLEVADELLDAGGLLKATIEEVVLRRPIGGPDVHKEQLEQLIKLGRLRNVELQVMPTDRVEHAGMGGAFVLLTPKGKPQAGYTEAQNSSRLITDPEEVRILAARYGSIRAQALTPRESLDLMEDMLGER